MKEIVSVSAVFLALLKQCKSAHDISHVVDNFLDDHDQLEIQ